MEGEASDTHHESRFSMDSWIKAWNDGHWGFHCLVVNDLIMKYYDSLVEQRTDLRFFLPLCGKSLDMKWLADKGHHVVGIDCASRAAVDFFAENKIEYDVSEVKTIENCSLYKSKDGKIEFYVCDYFALTKDVIGEFDVIWDRGSLNSMPLDKSSQYVELMKKFMKPGTKIMIEIFECYKDDGEVIKGLCLLEDDIRRLYGNCSCEILETFKYADIAKNMAMTTEDEETWKKEVEEEKKCDCHDQPEDGGQEDYFKNMCGKVYLLKVK